MRKNDPEVVKRQGFALAETKFFVGYRWNKGGKQEEAREAFKLFDKKDRDVINAGDLKAMLANYLEFPVSQSDIDEFMAMCNGGEVSDNVRMDDFRNFYLS